MTIIYLDANVFVYATVSQQEIGERSRSVIKDVESARIQAASSALTFDEVVWVVKKFRGREAAEEVGATLINMTGLKLTEVNVDTLSMALQLIKEYGLNPRDSIHAASAISVGAEYILSDDGDFDKLKQKLRRKAI